MRKALLAAVALALVQSTQALAETYVVRDQAQFRAIDGSLKAGDEVVLANGEWRDFRILLEGRGTADRPIVLRGETPGGVILTGQSNLRLSGEHLVVSDLVFRNGHSPTDELIAFRRDSRRVANNSRVTRVVIDGFTNPDRRAEDIWVAIYGQDNRVDHSHFEGKANAGVTLAVIRPRGNPEPNRARIDHNYFGPRPVLGSNGGETIRIGTSEESLSDSNTIVENNYFEHTDGEVEIVSSKSGGNIYRGNVFFEAQGALVLRHGSGNLVERNVFIGNNRPHTGGIRVINPRQTVRDNYLEGLSGTGFASAITVMNGVPNSVINRYHQVVGAVIERNSVIEPARISLAAGADAERSAAPIDTRFDNNLIVSNSGRDPFRAEGDISGISFAGNIQTPVAGPLVASGFDRRQVTLTRTANGLLYPADGIQAGAPRDLQPIRKEQTGVDWYPKRGPGGAAFDSGRRIDARRGALAETIARASSGDTIRLPAGDHLVTAPIVIDKTVTIAGPAGARPTRISFSAPTLFQIESGGRLRLANVTISGARAPRAPGNAVIRSAPRSTPANYAIAIEDSVVSGLNNAPGFDVIATTPATLAERILIRGSRFHGVSGAVVAATSETGAGLYNAEQVDIERSQFQNVGIVADMLRNGRDESTFGPRLRLTGSTIASSGQAGGASLRLNGVQFATIEGNCFEGSAPIEVIHSVGTPQTRVANNCFNSTPMPVLRELYAQGPHRAVIENNRQSSNP